jgi:FtsP/CotA-like multicopper oxidase with cupredoxin domain
MLNKRAASAVPLRRLIGAVSVIMALCAAGGVAAMAQTPVAPVANACQRFAAGSVVQQPPALFSQNGVLSVQFSYQTTTDIYGRQLYCFMTPAGMEDPTLYVNPGDTLNITVTNNTPAVPTTAGVTVTTEALNPPNCGDTTQISQNPLIPQSAQVSAANAVTSIVPPTGGSMNIHYHGTNTTPGCGGDNVVKTLVNPGSTFSYSLVFPTTEPPGLYWYHPHVHGLAEAAVQGGASGGIVVEGIQDVQPATASLPQRILIIRDQPTFQNLGESAGDTPGGIPLADVTVNNITTNACTNTATFICPNATNTVSGSTFYTPAIIQMGSGDQEFWRISNSASDTILDLQVVFDGVPQTIQIVGIDGVPVNSQDGTQPGQLIPVTHFHLPPASRVEFIVSAPPSSVQLAQLVTQLINTGPLGDEDPARPLLTIQLVPALAQAAAQATLPDGHVPAFTALNTSQQLFAGIASVTPAVTRTLYFEEIEDGNAFYMNAASCVTASGSQCPNQVALGVPIDTVFDPNNPPSIITTQGTVEKWIVQNHARENHEFHQHQVHFQVLGQDNFEANGSQPAPAITGQFLDMIEVPFCGGPAAQNGTIACLVNGAPTGAPAIPYPQVQLLLDFRGMDIGDFVFHCHILGHEDLGMMAIEQVCPSTGCTTN